MVDHATHLKAVNNPIRKAMLKAINKVNKISHSDLVNELKNNEILEKDDMFEYHMNFLVQAECVKKIELNDGLLEYEILEPGKIVEKY